MRMSMILLSLLVFVSCQQAPTGPQGLTDADKEQIRAIDETFVKAILAKDASTAASLYTEDAITLFPNTEMVRGRANIQKSLEASSTQGELHQFTFEQVEVHGVGDLAYVVGTNESTFTPKGSTRPITTKGKYVFILRKQADGSWKMVVDSASGNEPLPQQSESASGN